MSYLNLHGPSHSLVLNKKINNNFHKAYDLTPRKFCGQIRMAGSNSPYFRNFFGSLFKCSSLFNEN